MDKTRVAQLVKASCSACGRFDTVLTYDQGRGGLVCASLARCGALGGTA